jgi:hypothetical protein
MSSHSKLVTAFELFTGSREPQVRHFHNFIVKHFQGGGDPDPPDSPHVSDLDISDDLDDPSDDDDDDDDVSDEPLAPLESPNVSDLDISNDSDDLMPPSPGNGGGGGGSKESPEDHMRAAKLREVRGWGNATSTWNEPPNMEDRDQAQYLEPVRPVMHTSPTSMIASSHATDQSQANFAAQWGKIEPSLPDPTPNQGEVWNVILRRHVPMQAALKMGHILNISPYDIDGNYIIVLDMDLLKYIMAKEFAPCAYRPLVPIHESARFPHSKVFLNIGTLFSRHAVVNIRNLETLQKKLASNNYEVYQLTLEQHNSPMYTIQDYYKSTPHQFKTRGADFTEYANLKILRSAATYPHSIQKALQRYSHKWDRAINMYLELRTRMSERSVWKQPAFIQSLENIKSMITFSRKTHKDLRKDVNQTIRILQDNAAEYGTVNDDPTLVVYRGQATPFDQRQLVDGVWTKPGFMSTSLDPRVSKQFQRNSAAFTFSPTGPLFKIHVPIGAIYYDMMASSDHSREYELLFMPGTKLRLVSDVPKDPTGTLVFQMIVDQHNAPKLPPTKCQLYDQVSITQGGTTRRVIPAIVTMLEYERVKFRILEAYNRFINHLVTVVPTSVMPIHIQLKTYDTERICKFISEHETLFRNRHDYLYDKHQFCAATSEETAELKLLLAAK